MIEITTSIEVEATCEVCGRTMRIRTENLDTRKNVLNLEIAPCEACLNNAEDRGYNNGIKSA